MAAAQAQAAQEAWHRLPELRRYCAQRAVSRRGASLAQLIQGGVQPNDPRLGEVMGECARFDQVALGAGMRCSVKYEAGWSVQSRCNQVFVRNDGYGQRQILDARAAIDLHFNGVPTSLVEIETDAGRQERADAQRRLAEVNRLRGELEPFQSSRSPVVRSQAQGLVQRALMTGNPETAPSEAALDALRREQQRLSVFEQGEIARLDALDRAAVAKAIVERKLASAPPALREEAGRLNATFAILSKPPTPPQAPKPAAKTAERLGPPFDCEKAKSPIEHVICADPGLGRLDLEMVQAYYVLRHALPEQRPTMRQEMIDFSRGVVERCRLGDSGAIAPRAIRAAVPCVSGEYRHERDRWRERVGQTLAGFGREEALRPIDEHVALQRQLQTAGYISSDETADGVYGAKTRTAIAALQSAEGLPGDGLMSRATAERLARRAPAAAVELPRIEGATAQRLAALHGQYAALADRIDEAEGRRVREGQLVAKATEARAYLQSALALPLRDDLRETLAKHLAVLEVQGTTDLPALGRAVAGYEAAKPVADEALAVTRATTPKNAVLVEGDPLDILVLVNNTGRAPSVIRNLRGELVFEGGRAVACQPNGGTLDGAVAEQVNARLRRYELSLRFPLQRCSTNGLPANDLVVVARGELLKERATAVTALMSAVDAGVLTPLATVTSADVRAAAQADAVRRTEVEADVEKGRPGYGLIALGGVSGPACLAVTADREAHEVLVRPLLPRAENGAPPTSIVATSADGAFMSAKRGQCGTIYASSPNLRDLAVGLRRDGLVFRYLAAWITAEEITAAKEAISAGRTRELQQEADRRRQRDDENRLQREKDQDADVVRQRVTAELQKKNGAQARAIEGKLAAEMKAFVEDRTSQVAIKYPQVATWYAQMLQDRWELMTVDTQLADYGVAEFKGRSLDTGFARTMVKMRNRVLGEYREQCWMTGFIDDQEFQMAREPFAARCEAADGPVTTYQTGQRFTSRWLAP